MSNNRTFSNGNRYTPHSKRPKWARLLDADAWNKLQTCQGTPLPSLAGLKRDRAFQIEVDKRMMDRQKASGIENKIGYLPTACDHCKHAAQVLGLETDGVLKS